MVSKSDQLDKQTKKKKKCRKAAMPPHRVGEGSNERSGTDTRTTNISAFKAAGSSKLKVTRPHCSWATKKGKISV